MSESESQRRLRDGLPLLLLAAILVLGFLRSDDVRQMAELAWQSRSLIRSDADLLRTQMVLGPDYALVERLKREHPPGTPVSVQGRGPSLGRSQRFWLALLPDYPIRADARLVLCPPPCAGAGDRVVAEGDEFVLLERADAGAPGEP